MVVIFMHPRAFTIISYYIINKFYFILITHHWQKKANILDLHNIQLAGDVWRHNTLSLLGYFWSKLLPQDQGMLLVGYTEVFYRQAKKPRVQAFTTIPYHTNTNLTKWSVFTGGYGAEISGSHQNQIFTEWAFPNPAGSNLLSNKPTVNTD